MPADDHTFPTYTRIFAVVERIPKGCVATYGQIAALAGLPRRARQVGYALHALPEDSEVPWHRVVNALGRISQRSTAGMDQLQRFLLEQEGIRFDERGRIDLDEFRWDPDGLRG